MSFIPFLWIVYYIDEPQDFLSFSKVCKSSMRACQHLKTQKQHHFQRISVSWNWEGSMVNPNWNGSIVNPNYVHHNEASKPYAAVHFLTRRIFYLKTLKLLEKPCF